MKELLVCCDAIHREVNILVPKRRGEGFLKSPIGHNNSPLARLSHEIGYDLFGLDGSIDIQVLVPHRLILGDPVDNPDLIPWVTPLVEPIAAHYGMTWKLINSREFWDKHPIPRHGS